MTTAGGGGGMFWGVKRQNIAHWYAIRHDSLFFTILLGALEGSCRLALNAKERTGLPTYMYNKRTNSPVNSRTAQYIRRQSGALSIASSPMSS